VRLVLDTGALIALERNDRAMWRRITDARASREPPISHGGIVAQAWRGGARQALLAKSLSFIDVRSIDEALGRKTGALLAKSRTKDVVDAALVLIADDGDRIFTSDPEDIAHLAEVADLYVEIIEV
jgi:hypothetical protein